MKIPLLSRLVAGARRQERLHVHAYVLLTNHVHLLVSAERPEASGTLMKALGQRYVQYVNRTYRRSGTLWEGRFRSCLTQKESYLLACQRHIELNPVRAGMVEHPAEQKWGQTTVVPVVLTLERTENHSAVVHFVRTKAG